MSAPPTGSTDSPWVLALCCLTGLVVLFDCFFNSMVVGVPCSLISRHFCLFIDFRSVVILLLVVRGSEGFLLMPPAWPDLPWRCWLLTHISKSLPSEPCSTFIYKRQKVTQNEQWIGCNRTKRREAVIYLPLNTGVNWRAPHWEGALCLFISEAVESLLQLFTENVLLAGLMAFPSLPSFWSLPFSSSSISLQQGVCPLSSPSLPLYWDPFLYRKKKTKQREKR